MIPAGLTSAYLDWVCLIISDMSNDWFQFKNFLVRQDQSAMKVGTDGVLLGAWADCRNCSHILDIGTGTGLIALILAQRNETAGITAVEIEAAAFNQAVENVADSPWPGRIEVVHCDFRSWNPAADPGFDLIVCNPPFFTRSLKAPDNQRSTARHDDELPLSILIPKAARLLAQTGRLALILPVGRAQDAITLANENELHLYRRTDVKGNIHAHVKRVLLEWGYSDRPVETSGLAIESTARGIYTDQYRGLTGEFYPGPNFTQ
jgi:tRNA1Val (adenine37-N6)-methyltransferase